MHMLLRERMNVLLLRLESFVNVVATFFLARYVAQGASLTTELERKVFQHFPTKLLVVCVCLYFLTNMHERKMYFRSKVLLCKNPLLNGTYFVRNALNQAQI